MTTVRNELVRLYAASTSTRPSPPRIDVDPMTIAKQRHDGTLQLELELRAYAQGPGVENVNACRFESGALELLAQTARGVPFCQMHRSSVHGGVVLGARVGSFQGRETMYANVLVTDPGFAAQALLGEMRGISIGFQGVRYCSICGPNGDVCGALGTERFVFSHRAGAYDDGRRVEHVYAIAAMREISEVDDPAVTCARVELVRIAGPWKRESGAALIAERATRTKETAEASAPRRLPPSPRARRPRSYIEQEASRLAKQRHEAVRRAELETVAAAWERGDREFLATYYGSAFATCAMTTTSRSIG